MRGPYSVQIWGPGSVLIDMNLGRKRSLPRSPLVHAAAFERKGYRLPECAIRVDTMRW
jgi:hypothetical protein